VPLGVPSSLDYFATLVAQDDGFPLLEAAIAVGQDRDATLDPQSVMVALDRLGARLARRIPSDAVPLQRLRWLNRYFFDELAFGGNVNDYYAADNSYLHCVLDSRRGIPITLALLYMEMAAHAGLKARGISFPGHFLVKLRLPRGEVVIDPFSLLGDFEVPLGLFLQEATPREFLSRLLRNLKEIHLSAENWPALLQVQERLVRLVPLGWAERRDRGLAYAELGLDDLALADLQTYLQHCGEAEDAPALRERMSRMGGADNGRRPS